MFPIRDTIPHRHKPVMTLVLIAGSVAAFLFELSLSPPALRDLLDLCGLVPARYTDPLYASRHLLPAHDYWPFLTSLFLHGGWLHLIGNLWTLWIFGDNVEDRLGPLGFLGFYLACGVLAGGVHLATNPHSMVPTIGASGAIAGVMGAYFVLYPRARIVTLVPVFFWPLFVELPAVLYLGLWLLLQLYTGTLSLTQGAVAGGIAWWAHVGGFASGIGLLLLFSRRRSPHRRPR
jgi:membrane associated rhomboid family serine protease